MSSKSRRSVIRRPFLNSCLLLGLLLAGVAGLPSLTRKVGAVFVAPGFPENTKAVPTAATESATQTRLRQAYGQTAHQLRGQSGPN